MRNFLICHMFSNIIHYNFILFWFKLYAKLCAKVIVIKIFRDFHFLAS